MYICIYLNIHIFIHSSIYILTVCADVRGCVYSRVGGEGAFVYGPNINVFSEIIRKRMTPKCLKVHSALSFKIHLHRKTYSSLPGGSSSPRSL